MIKNIIFDWGGVLIENPDEDIYDYCSKFLSVDREEFKNIWQYYSSKFQTGEIEEKQIWREICQELNGKEPNIKSLWEEVVKNTFKDQKEVFKVVEELKKDGYKVYFLSNTELPAVDYFFDNHYDKYFDGQMFSCVEGLVKPDRKIYELEIERFNIKPEESIFIDDKEENVEGSEEIGIKGIVFKSTGQFIKELKILLKK